MSTSDTNTGINHKRNLLIIVAVFVFGYIGWIGFGAAQCILGEGDLQIRGFGFLCVQDYSNR